MKFDIEGLDQIGRALERARETSGLSVETLAERLRVDPFLITQNEAHGYRDATIAHVSDVIRTLDLTVKISVSK